MTKFGLVDDMPVEINVLEHIETFGRSACRSMFAARTRSRPICARVRSACRSMLAASTRSRRVCHFLAPLHPRQRKEWRQEVAGSWMARVPIHSHEVAAVVVDEPEPNVDATPFAAPTLELAHHAHER